MTETADVIIIGGGIVGSSIAYNLAVQGCTNVLIIEREERQGLGSTSKSMGGVRAQFATPINIQMSRYSIDVFSRFEVEMRLPILTTPGVLEVAGFGKIPQPFPRIPWQLWQRLCLGD